MAWNSESTCPGMAVKWHIAEPPSRDKIAKPNEDEAGGAVCYLGSCICEMTDWDH
jgi:hypothetical protein